MSQGHLISVFESNRQRKTKIENLEKANRKILDRLQNSSPTYNVEKWRDDDKRIQKYFKLRCEFPVVLNQKKNNSNISNNSTSYGSIRHLFAKPRLSNIYK